MNDVTDLMVFGFVVALRFIVPLFIPRFPLPAIIACLVIDGVDQTIFQKFTDRNLDNYQSYDKALDNFYLAIAYLATIRNWENQAAFEFSRFLYYFRLAGVVLFEATHLRAFLLLFPNTFEYFFIFYETVRLRWNPMRLSAAVVIGAGGAIWAFIKIPQEYWIHIAQKDVTDELAARPALIYILAFAVVALVVVAWWVVTRRLPAADNRMTFRIDDPFSEELYRTVNGLARSRRGFDLALLEKVILISLISAIFSQILPDLVASGVQIGFAVGILVALNTVISEFLARRGIGWETVLKEFVAMGAVNVGLLLIARWLLMSGDSGFNIGATLFYLVLVTLLITLYDRYQPYMLIRAAEREGKLPELAMQKGT